MHDSGDLMMSFTNLLPANKLSQGTLTYYSRDYCAAVHTLIRAKQ